VICLMRIVGVAVVAAVVVEYPGGIGFADTRDPVQP